MCKQYNPVEMYIVYMCTKTGNEDMNFCLYKCANRCYTIQQPSHCGSAGTLDLSSRHDVLFFIPELTPLTILSCCRDFQVSQETRHHSTCISIPARPAQMFCLGRNSSSRLLSATQFHSFGPSHSGKHEKSSKCRTARRTHRTSAHTHDHFVNKLPVDVSAILVWLVLSLSRLPTTNSKELVPSFQFFSDEDT